LVPGSLSAVGGTGTPPAPLTEEDHVARVVERDAAALAGCRRGGVGRRSSDTCCGMRACDTPKSGLPGHAPAGAACKTISTHECTHGEQRAARKWRAAGARGPTILITNGKTSHHAAPPHAQPLRWQHATQPIGSKSVTLPPVRSRRAAATPIHHKRHPR